MPTATNTGTVTFREVSKSEGVNFDGSDSLTVRLRGASSLIDAASASWTRYKTYPGYPDMYLTSKTVNDRGPVSEIELTFTGFIESLSPNSGLLSVDDDISLQSVQLTSDEDENVSFFYYATTTTYRWVSRGESKPERPRFSISVPTDIPVGFLFNPSPPNYNGSTTSAYSTGARLIQFKRTRITPELWIVDETWQLKVEPV